MINDRIHKFEQNGNYILLDINSGSVHVVDEMVYAMMDVFDGTNDAQTLAALGERFPIDDVAEALGELHELMEAGELFTPNIENVPAFRETGVVKSLCLMIAQDCNLRCKYCFGAGGSYGEHRALMSEEVGKAAVDFLLESSKKRKHCEIDFFGGEPLMNMKTIKPLTAYIRQKERETG